MHNEYINCDTCRYQLKPLSHVTVWGRPTSNKISEHGKFLSLSSYCAFKLVQNCLCTKLNWTVTLHNFSGLSYLGHTFCTH